MYDFDTYEIIDRPILPSQHSTAAETAADELEDIQLAILRNTTPERYNATCALLERFEMAVRKAVKL